MNTQPAEIDPAVAPEQQVGQIGQYQDQGAEVGQEIPQLGPGLRPDRLELLVAVHVDRLDQRVVRQGRPEKEFGIGDRHDGDDAGACRRHSGDPAPEGGGPRAAPIPQAEQPPKAADQDGEQQVNDRYAVVFGPEQFARRVLQGHGDRGHRNQADGEARRAPGDLRPAEQPKQREAAQRREQQEQELDGEPEAKADGQTGGQAARSARCAGYKAQDQSDGEREDGHYDGVMIGFRGERGRHQKRLHQDRDEQQNAPQSITIERCDRPDQQQHEGGMEQRRHHDAPPIEPLTEAEERLEH